MLFAYSKLTVALIVSVVGILSIVFFDYLTKKKGDKKDGECHERKDE